MPPKRATVPTNTFGAGPTALDKLTGRATPTEPEALPTPLEPVRTASPTLPQNSDTVKLQNGKTVSQQDGAGDEGVDDSNTREKITFYLRPDQVEKLDELVIAYKRRTGQRTNRNALMRLVLDRLDIDLLLTNA